MSAALVRQALEFVDPDEHSINKRKKRGGSAGAARHQLSSGQDKKSKKVVLKKDKHYKEKEERKLANAAVKKLLKLSQPTVDSTIAGKIIERAVKGKALTDKIEVNNEPEKSILFPDDETFEQFEEELFCS